MKVIEKKHSNFDNSSTCKNQTLTRSSLGRRPSKTPAQARHGPGLALIYHNQCCLQIFSTKKELTPGTRSKIPEII